MPERGRATKLALGVALLAGVVTATSGVVHLASDGGGGSTLKRDVTITSCAADERGNLRVVGRVHNSSATRSIYKIGIVEDTADASGPGPAETISVVVGAGATAKWSSGTAHAPTTDLDCGVAEVFRTSYA